MSKIYINPGHGGTDSGAVGVGGRQEKADNLRYASAVAEKLRAAGHDVKLERDSDVLINVKDIAKNANHWGADLFVAFHRNASDGKGHGVECLVVPNASQTSHRMAEAIAAKLGGVGFEMRHGNGVKIQNTNVHVLSHTTMPATTIECGFIDNAGDNALFDSKQGEIVQGITDAVLSIAGGAEQSPATPPAQPAYTKKSFTLDHVVKKGSKEAVVGSIQNNLLAMGYDLGSTGIDNNFGTKTDAAVRDVQKNGGVTVDGQVGKNTTPLLGGTWAEKSASAASIPALTRNLKLTSPMMRGDDVRQAQERLEKHLAQPGKIDGVFGNSTKEAVIRFQQARKNEGRDIGEVDGVIGQKTWKILWE